jgi:CRISPR-associated protein Cmr3
MKNVQLEALDTLFFRNGRPFSMGEETWADAVFPPYPSVLYGTLRTAYGLSLGADLMQIQQDTKDIEVHDIYLALDDKTASKQYYPMPLDLVTLYKQDNDTAIALQPKLKPKLTSSSAGTHLLLAPGGERVAPVEDAWMDMVALERYLKGETQNLSFNRLKDYTLSEPKIGIGRDNYTRTTEEGKLYRVGMVRTANCRIGVQFSKASKESAVQATVARLGAEAKMAAWKEVPSQKLQCPQQTLQIGDCFRVWTTTPAILGTGYVPELETLFGIKATFLAGVTGRTLSIGGWDMHKRQPKPLHQAVPGGSVWHFRADDTIDLSKFQGSSISAVGAEQGFGIAYFGISNKNLYV